MDDCDKASEYEQKWLAGHLEEHRHQLRQAEIAEAGRCRNCETKLDDGRTFCDVDCRADFEKRLNATKRNVNIRG